MKNGLLTILLCSLIGSLCFSSCQTEDVQQEKVKLSVRTALTDRGVASRNNLQKEAMHNLRIIIQRPDGSVEHNRLLVFGAYVLESDEMMFEVIPDETKKIYLFSNAENIPDLNLAGIDTKAELEAVGTFVINGKDYYNSEAPLPMCTVHEVLVEAVDKSVDLYIVRAACKVTFEFENISGGSVTIGGWKLQSLADRSFLMPRISETGWIQKMVNDAEDGENVDSHWITNYAVPGDAVHEEWSRPLSLSLSAGSTASDAPVYMHESKFLNSGSQQYSIGVTINGTEYQASLPNLQSMVRNTHVKVHVTITKSELDCKVSVYPYRGVDLYPNFGLSE